MWMGRGFDTDGDGENDLFIASQLSKKDSQAVGVGMLLTGFVLAVAFGVVLVLEWFGKGSNQQALAAGASTLWSWVVTVSFYGFYGLLITFAAALMILVILSKKQ